MNEENTTSISIFNDKKMKGIFIFDHTNKFNI